MADSPVKVSCRFTLCHPPSVDAALLGLVGELQRRLGMEAIICDDLRPEHAHCFSPARFSEFAGIVPGYIAQRRADWIAQFGTAQLPAKTPEVYEKIILPKCVPAAG